MLILLCWIGLVSLCSQGRTHKVKYIVTGATSSASLTYQNQSGDTEQIAKAHIPWEKTFEARDGMFLYISAQNLNELGSVVTEIEVDGKPYNRSTSEGGFVIATSSFRCCP